MTRELKVETIDGDGQVRTTRRCVRTLADWKKRDWRTADRKPVKNRDLWQQLEAAASRHDVEWHWVRGHSGHPENERADALANRGIDELATAAPRP